VKGEYAIDMTTDHISTAKGQILRKARKKKPAATKPAEPHGQARAAPQRNGISLEDIEAVQGLVGRVGADGLKRLIDVLAR
jgi:hypothetical protein